MATLQHFPIFKKRDGQSFEQVGDIYTDTFQNAKKEWAKKISQELHNQSGYVWLTVEQDGVSVTGFYDFTGGSPLFDGVTEKYDANETADFLLVSEESINEGFETWCEYVYTWKLRQPMEENSENE